MSDYGSKIAAAWARSRESIFECGRLLIEAKRDLGHGAFMRMIETELPFGARTAERLMTIAADQRLSNSTLASILPASWTTLYELSALSDAQLNEGIENGTTSPDMTRVQAATLSSKFRVVTQINPARPTRTVEMETEAGTFEVRAQPFHGHQGSELSATRKPDGSERTEWDVMKSGWRADHVFELIRRINYLPIDLDDLGFAAADWDLSKKLARANIVRKAMQALAGILALLEDIKGKGEND